MNSDTQLHGDAHVCSDDVWLRAVLDNMVDAVITIDAQGIIQTIHRAAERIFGYSGGDVTGPDVSMLAAEHYNSAHDGYIRNYMETGQAKVIGIEREVEGRRKDGSTFPMILAISDVRVRGRITFVGIIRDITQRKAWK